MSFNFNSYSSLLLIGFLQGVVFATLLFWRGMREDRLSDKLLAVLLLLSAFHIAHYMLGFGGWYDSHDALSSFMFYFPFHNFLWIAPTIYFYFRSLTNRGFSLEYKHFWHFLPGLIYFLEYVVIFLLDVVYQHWMLGQAFPLHYGTKGLGANFNQGTIQEVFSYLGLISTYIYLWLTLIEYRQYRKYIYNHFSDTITIEFRWLRNILYLLIIGLTVTWCFNVLGSFMPLSYEQYWNSHLVIGLMIYFVSIFGYSNTMILPHSLEFEPAPRTPTLLSEQNSEESELNQWKQKLVRLMETEQCFLNPSLTLADLASKLSTNTSLVSKVINNGFGQNFNDFVNSYRIAAFEKSLRKADARQYTLSSLAFDCGFNSKATFNRAFRKLKGMSPREFQQQIGQG